MFLGSVKSEWIQLSAQGFDAKHNKFNELSPCKSEILENLYKYN